MKKIISTLLVVMVLFNFIWCNDVYADPDETDTSTESTAEDSSSSEGSGVIKGESSITEDKIKPTELEAIVNGDPAAITAADGTTSKTQITWNSLGNIFETIIDVLFAGIFNLFPMLLHTAMSLIADSDSGLFTIEDLVFNQIDFFNVNFLKFDENFNAISASTNEIIRKNLGDSIAKFYMILRLIAITLSLIILIYVGIRMAIASVASDKAKYKQMLIGWLESVVVLFTLQYIISIILNLGDIFNDIVWNLKENASLTGESFETKIIVQIYNFMSASSGWTYVAYSLVYWILVFIQTKFFLSYFKRLISVGFLILISPIVTVTYALDKLGDGKAQAFTVWLTEFAMNVFIQPVHAIIYLVFMFTAGEIAQYSILIALVFLWYLTKVEKVILNLFNLKNVVSLMPVDDERNKKG